VPFVCARGREIEREIWSVMFFFSAQFLEFSPLQKAILPFPWKQQLSKQEHPAQTNEQ